jgi:hypothetical protein
MLLACQDIITRQSFNMLLNMSDFGEPKSPRKLASISFVPDPNPQTAIGLSKPGGNTVNRQKPDVTAEAGVTTQQDQCKEWKKRLSAILFPNTDTTVPICDVCGEPKKPTTDDKPHELSWSHQLALPREKPKGSNDRMRFGFRQLEKHGYDPEERPGLGAQGQGITKPLALAPKRDRLGLGHSASVKQLVEAPQLQKNARTPVEAHAKVHKPMNAKECKKQYEEEKKKAEKFRSLFYSDNHEELFNMIGATKSFKDLKKSTRRYASP